MRARTPSTLLCVHSAGFRLNPAHASCVQKLRQLLAFIGDDVALRELDCAAPAPLVRLTELDLPLTSAPLGPTPSVMPLGGCRVRVKRGADSA